MNKPIYKSRLFWILSVICAVILTIVIVYFSCYAIQVAIIRVICPPKEGKEPVGYDEILANTAVLATDLEYDSSYEKNKMDIYAPANNTEELPLFVYLHGGYYIGGDKLEFQPYCRMIASRGFVVANVNYELAPEAHYPSQLLQANDALTFLIENADTYNIDVNQVFIGGDSAGSHLTSQLGCLYTNRNFSDNFEFTAAITSQQLLGVVLLCGFFDIDTAGLDEFPFASDAMWVLTNERDYRTSKTGALLNTVDFVDDNYPDVYITCGADDPFYAQAQKLVSLLAVRTIPTVSYLPDNDEYELKHEFQKDFSLDEAYVAINMLYEFLADKVS